MIMIFAPAGIAEVGPQTDLGAEILAATEADPSGPLADGDIVVVTSKIISKAESRQRPAARRDQLISEETVRTVSRRGTTRIVRTRQGLTLAAAGVDNSNVAADSVLLLPVDPDASAARLRQELQARSGKRLGVIISDTAGRAWRLGQTDQAIGAAGVRVIERYAGQRDRYGNELQVTATALADELAAAADLAKSKLSGRPVAVIRGLGQHLVGDLGDERSGAAAETRATLLVRAAQEDLFGYGSREAVLAAILAATGQTERYEDIVRYEIADLRDVETLVESIVSGSRYDGSAADLLRVLLAAALRP